MGRRGKLSGISEAIVPRFDHIQPPKPSYLQGIASEQWDSLCPQLFKAGVLDAVTGPLLEGLCLAIALRKEAFDEMNKIYTDKNGKQNKLWLVRTKTGGMQKNPLEQVYRNADERVNDYLDRLGMTPKTRGRVHVYTADLIKPSGTNVNNTPVNAATPQSFGSDDEIASEIDAAIKEELEKQGDAAEHNKLQV